jgi:NADPH-dependent 2,4-dienoyl-CoA reductase/sulfur reductase-like enzyme
VKNQRYLIVGGGMTAHAACQGIRSLDSDGVIRLVSEDRHPPYKRPPLTKSLWTGGTEESIQLHTADLGVELELGRKIVSLDLDARRATDDAGEVHGYERLLLATGGRPRRLPFGGDDVVYLRTLDDYHRVRALADDGARFAVIGGGFIGSEIAAALATNGAAVTMVFPEHGIGARGFPAELASYVTDYYRARGVEVLTGDSVAGIHRDGRIQVSTRSGRVLEVDGVVAGLGIEPAIELAAAGGLPVEDGVVVDDRGRAGGREDVFAAGDVARFPAAALGTATRVEHEDHANSHGAAVGANMAGAGTAYDHLPFFYSDLFDLGYEAVGEVDSRHATIAAWAEPNRQGVVCYVDGDRRPRGFLLWNVWDRVEAARELIGAGEPVDEGALRVLMG